MTTLLIIGLMVVALILIALEVLVIPGFGVPGVLGLLAGAGAGYLAVTRLPPAQAGLTIAAGVVAAGVIFWYFPRTRVARSMVLETQTKGSAAPTRLAALAGREGVALTPLRPSGTVEIDGEAIDVVSDGQYIDSGARVRVIEVAGARVVVDPVPADEPAPPAAEGPAA